MDRVQCRLVFWGTRARVDLVLEHEREVALDEIGLFRVELGGRAQFEQPLEPIAEVARCHGCFAIHAWAREACNDGSSGNANSVVASFGVAIDS